MARRGLGPVLVAGAVAAALPAIVHILFGGHRVSFTGHTHVYSVGFSSLVAAIAAVGLTIVGARRGDTRTMLVGTAFAVMAGLLALHGIATPFVWFDLNGVASLTGAATLPVGALILAVSVLPLPRVLRNVGPLLAFELLLLLGVIALGASALAWPGLLPSVPEPSSGPAMAVLAIGLVAYGLLALRALRTFLLTQRLLDLVVVVGLVWLATALIPALTMDYLQLGWWVGHEVELDGILLVGLAVAVDLARSAQSRPLAGDLRGAELVASEDAFLGSHVRALMVWIANKDAYTERHTRSVARLAVGVGEQLGLAGGRLRTLAIGALVHDIGKVSTPDEILKKPDALDEDEYAIIKQHPEQGYKLLGELGGFSDGVRRLVRNHHERLDGKGYPHGLVADALDLDTRILTVCDVYDALISKRVYRDAWTHDAAMDYMRREVGTAFDERCVDALARFVEGDAKSTSVAATPVVTRAFASG